MFAFCGVFALIKCVLWILLLFITVCRFSLAVFNADLMNVDPDKYPMAPLASYYHAVLEAGEVLYIPGGAAHQVENEGQTTAIAMNIVDEGTLLSFRKHALLATKMTVDTSHSMYSRLYTALQPLQQEVLGLRRLRFG